MEPGETVASERCPWHAFCGHRLQALLRVWPCRHRTPIASAWLVRGSRLARVLSSAAAGASTSAAGEENLEFLMDVLKESIGVTGVSWCRGLWCACLLMLTRACSDSVRACARVMTLRVLRRSCSGD